MIVLVKTIGRESSLQFYFQHFMVQILYKMIAKSTIESIASYTAMEIFEKANLSFNYVENTSKKTRFQHLYHGLLRFRSPTSCLTCHGEWNDVPMG